MISYAVRRADVLFVSPTPPYDITPDKMTYLTTTREAIPSQGRIEKIKVRVQCQTRLSGQGIPESIMGNFGRVLDHPSLIEIVLLRPSMGGAWSVVPATTHVLLTGNLSCNSSVAHEGLVPLDSGVIRLSEPGDKIGLQVNVDVRCRTTIWSAEIEMHVRIPDA